MRTRMLVALMGFSFLNSVECGTRINASILTVESTSVYLGDVETVDGSFFFGSWYEADFRVEGEVDLARMRFTAPSPLQKGSKIWATIEYSNEKTSERVIVDWGNLAYLECLMGIDESEKDLNLDSFKIKLGTQHPWYCREISENRISQERSPEKQK